MRGGRSPSWHRHTALHPSAGGEPRGTPGWGAWMDPPPTSRLSTRAADLPNMPKTWGSLCKTRETPRQMRASRVLDDGWSVLTSYNHSVVTRQLRGTREKEAARPARGIEVRRWGRVVTQAWKSKPPVTMSPETWGGRAAGMSRAMGAWEPRGVSQTRRVERSWWHWREPKRP